MSTQTCYRHTTRATGASCTRCERPICPDCMIEAPVGHHCPTCVHEARTGMRKVKRVVFARGGITVAGGVACTALVLVNVVVFLLDASQPTLFARFADNAVLVARNGEYYRMFTAAFLHAGLLHLAFNMFGLYLFGSQVEAVVGVPRFATLYVLAAVGGSACSHFFGPPFQFSIGASGAVFGIFGAYFVIARSRGMDTSQVGALILINLFIGSVVPQIDNAAHVGGLLTGAAIAAAYEWSGRQQGWARHGAEVAGVLAVAAVLIVATLVRQQQLDSLFL